MELLGYYIDEDMDEEELKESKPLPEEVTVVTVSVNFAPDGTSDSTG